MAGDVLVGEQETRPGVKTTEFWAAAFTNALGLVQILAGPANIHDGKVATLLAIVNGAYIASRGIAKAGVPNTP